MTNPIFYFIISIIIVVTLPNSERGIMSRGARESHWLVMRRCLTIIRRLQRGPATRDELIQAVLDDDPDAYGGVTKKALLKRLERDIWHIRYSLYIDLRFSRSEGQYFLGEIEVPLLDLPDEALGTIEWLEKSFSDGDLPHHRAVHSLLDRLRKFLGPARSRDIGRQNGFPDLDLRSRDNDDIPERVWEGLRKAIDEGLEIEFKYASAYSDAPRRHRVYPYKIYFHRGHYYLHGYCLHVIRPDGRRVDRRRYIPYRLGRILELNVLPNKLPPEPPKARKYKVIYKLAPQIARGGVSRLPYIEVLDVERHKDGSVTVHGETDNIFWAVRELLHYGPNCKVLGGPEILGQIREIVREMARQYDE